MTPEEVGRLLNVSRETINQFKFYLTLLEKWQRRINLVSKNTLIDAWQRHILDSAQLVALYPANTKRVIDVGSGAGFPGLVLAIMGGVEVILVESDYRKATFLSMVISSLDLSAEVYNKRIETLPNLSADVITARALAPLPKLLKLVKNQLTPENVCLFLKGETVGDELTQLQSYYNITFRTYPSLSGLKGVVLEVKNHC